MGTACRDIKDFRTTTKLNNLLFEVQNVLEKGYYVSDSSPFIVKGWNRCFVYLQKAGSLSTFYSGYLTVYKYVIFHIRVGLTFFCMSLLKVRDPRVLFVGNPKTIPIFNFMFHARLNKIITHHVYGMDKWFGGFLNNNRFRRHFDKFLYRFRHMNVGQFMRTSFEESRRYKKILNFLRRPHFIIFLKTIQTAYFADAEVLYRLVPSLAIISPESRSFGFSGMAYSCPFPFSASDKHLHLHNLFHRLIQFVDEITKYTKFYEITSLSSRHLTNDKPFIYTLIEFAPLHKIGLSFFVEFFELYYKAKKVASLTWLEKLLGTSKFGYFNERLQFFGYIKNILKENALYFGTIFTSFLLGCTFRESGQLFDSNKNWFFFKNSHSFRSVMIIIKCLKQFQLQFLNNFPSKLKLFKRFKLFKNLRRIFRTRNRIASARPKLHVLRDFSNKMNSPDYLNKSDLYWNYFPFKLCTIRRLRFYKSIDSLNSRRLNRMLHSRGKFRRLLSYILRNKRKVRFDVIAKIKKKKKEQRKKPWETVPSFKVRVKRNTPRF
jgi:hypothetical protein